MFGTGMRTHGGLARCMLARWGSGGQPHTANPPRVVVAAAAAQGG